MTWILALAALLILPVAAAALAGATRHHTDRWIAQRRTGLNAQPWEMPGPRTPTGEPWPGIDQLEADLADKIIADLERDR